MIQKKHNILGPISEKPKVIEPPKHPKENGKTTAATP